MKKSMVVLTVVILLAAVLLTGCQDIFSTSDRDVERKGGLVMDGTINRWPEEETTGTGVVQTQPTVPTTEGYKYGLGTVMASDLNIRSGPGTGFASAGTVSRGDRVGIVQVVYSEDVPWGCFEDGWVCMDYVVMDDPSLLPLEDTDLKNALTLSAPTGVYAGPNTYYSAGSTYSRYASIEITGKAGLWYRTERGWVKAEDVYIYGTATKDPSVKVTVIPKDLNLRTHPNTTSKVIRTLKQNETLEIFIQVDINGKRWGCTKDGWVSMDYVQEEGSGLLVGTWYRCIMNDYSRSEYKVELFTFTADKKFTISHCTYNPANGSQSNVTVAVSKTYTYENNKLVFSDNFGRATPSSIDGNTLYMQYSNSQLTLKKGSVEDGVLQAQKYAQLAKSNAATNNTSLVGEWSEASLSDKPNSIYFGDSLQFYNDGTFELIYTGGFYLYDPETGKLTYDLNSPGQGGQTCTGIYSYDGTTLKMTTLWVEWNEYVDYPVSSHMITVQDGTVKLGSTTFHFGTDEQIAAKLFAAAE